MVHYRRVPVLIHWYGSPEALQNNSSAKILRKRPLPFIRLIDIYIGHFHANFKDSF